MSFFEISFWDKSLDFYAYHLKEDSLLLKAESRLENSILLLILF